MKRILRKVASLCVAAAMVAAFGVTALATDLPTAGTVGDNNPAEPLETTLVIQKELKVYNPSAAEVYGPGITYSYAIAGSTAGRQITDADGVKALTKAGPDGATITSSVAWPNDVKIPASADGEPNLKPITISFGSVTFPGAGVYRYAITETCSGKAAAGVIGDDTTAVRYLDVYVRDPKTGENGYQIYGYVLFVNDDDIDGSSAATNNLADVKKTQGFVEISSGSGTPTVSADSYYTYNVEVSKTLVNDAANDSNPFPFKLTFTKPTGVTGDFNLIADTDPLAMDTTVNTTIIPGNSVTYVGIPCGTTVGISEQNNVTAKIYYVTTTGAETNLDNFLLNPDAFTDAVTVSTTAGAKGEDKTVAFTNTYVLISPTGVALAILPFVILLTFGVGFLVAGTAKRKEDEA